MTTRDTGWRYGDLFLEMIAAERGSAANTLEAYRRDLEDFFSFLGRQKVEVRRAAAEDIRAWLADLAKRGLSPASSARRLSAVRGQGAVRQGSV